METPRIGMVEMTVRRLSFFLFMLICCGLFCALGAWQVKRLHWKENLISEMEKAYASPADKQVSPEQIIALKSGEYLRGRFTGVADFKKAFELSGQIDDGKPSRHLLVPFQLAPSFLVTLDMGPDFKAYGRGLEEASIQGIIKTAPTPNAFTPENNPAKNIWYSIDLKALKIAGLQPLILMPEKTPWKDFPAKPPEMRNQHLQYAIFWFTMAGLVLVLTVLSFRKK